MKKQCRTSITNRPKNKRGATTLVELIVAMVVMTMLFLASGSALVLAGRALPDPDSPLEQTKQGIDCLEEITSDLMYATDITTAGDKEVVFTVADRDHGDGGPETIRYAWSGTANDSLTREYNGGAAVNVCESVRDFSISWELGPKPLTETPRVLLVVAENPPPQSSQNDAKMSLIESWGFTVQLIDDGDSQADFDTARANNDVLYISEEVIGELIPGEISNETYGIVTEDPGVYDELGISTNSASPPIASQINISDTSHEITSVFLAGSLSICTGDEELVTADGTEAPGGQVLAIDVNSSKTSLMAIEVGGQLSDGDSYAAGRRVKLPWGVNNFDINNLTDDGKTLMRRAITWAATPVAYTSADLKIQTGDASTSVETAVTLLNKPVPD